MNTKKELLWGLWVYPKLDEECDDPVPGRIYLDAAAFGASADGKGEYSIHE